MAPRLCEDTCPPHTPAFPEAQRASSGLRRRYSTPHAAPASLPEPEPALNTAVSARPTRSEAGRSPGLGRRGARSARAAAGMDGAGREGAGQKFRALDGLAAKRAESKRSEPKQAEPKRAEAGWPDPISALGSARGVDVRITRLYYFTILICYNI